MTAVLVERACAQARSARSARCTRGGAAALASGPRLPYLCPRWQDGVVLNGRTPSTSVTRSFLSPLRPHWDLPVPPQAATGRRGAGARALGCRPRPRPRLPWPPCCERALARSRPGVRTACHSRRATEPCASASPSVTRLSQPCLPRQLAAMVKGGSPMTLSLESV